MPIRDIGNIHLNYSDLPWRAKVFVLGILTSFFALGLPAFVLDSSIYSSAPKSAVASTGQTHLVHVMHGSIRYVTAEEEERLFFWQEEVAPFVGVPVVAGLVMFFVAKARR